MEDLKWLRQHLPTLQGDLVTVVVTSHNSKDHVFAAIDSVLGQSFKNVSVLVVDDCSTDGSAEAIRSQYASERRVSLIETEQNSGAAGAPRNLGLRTVASAYVTFLDADDVLDRHAIANLVFAALGEDADIVCGRTERVQVRSGRRSKWYPNHYKIGRNLSNILDFPNLVEDTNSTAKLYRRDFLIKNEIFYPEGVIYEDLSFTTNAYINSRRTVVLPVRVYDWRIYPAEVRLSVTHQRAGVDNLNARLQALALVFEFAKSDALQPLQDILYLKFLKHDARIYLNDVFDLGLKALDERLEILRPYLENIPRRYFEQLGQMEARAYVAALRGNSLGVREALLYPNAVGTIAGQISEIETGTTRIWLPSNEKVEDLIDQRDFLEITEADVLETPKSTARVYHRVTSFRLAREIMVIGESFDPLNVLSQHGMSTKIVFRTTGTPRRTEYSQPVELVAAGKGRFTWQSKLPKFGLVPGHRHVRWNLSVTTTDGNFVNNSPIRIEREVAETESFRAAGRLNRLFALRHSFVRNGMGNLELVGAAYSGLRSRAYQLFSRTDYAVNKFIGKIRTKALENTSRLARYVYPIFRMMPLRKSTVFFESHMGRGVADSPAAIASEMAAQGMKLQKVWSVNNPQISLVDGVDFYVKRGAFRYFYYLATSKFIIDNQSMPRYFRKRAGQVYLQTWHGIPLKKMGLDEPAVKAGGKKAKKRITGAARLWDALVVPNDYFKRVFVPAFKFEGTQLSPGTPRNDVIISSPNADDKLRKKFGIPAHKKIVLYAPTFREGNRSSSRAATIPFEITEWVEKFGGQYHLVLRSHYLNRYRIPWMFRPYCTDLSAYPEVSDLYRLSDVLVTDYSSVMFDYVHTGKPILIFAYDYNEYSTSARGTYFDLRDEAPGRFVESVEEMFEALTDLSLLSSGYRERTEQFIKNFADGEDGKASSRAVNYIRKLL